MNYRNFGKVNWKVSALGFGIMRLPIIGNDSRNIDEVKAEKMIRYAIDNGVNYIDTAYGYHGGKSEHFVGKALKKGYREKIRLATKMPTWLVNSQADMDKYLMEQLDRLQTDFIDFYLLHGLNKQRWQKLQPLDILEWGDKAIAEGKIRHLGFSFHDDYDVFKKIVDSYKWTLCQIYHNYRDPNYQAGTKGLKYAASKGLAVVVMGPLEGGMLAGKPPKEIQAIWDEAETNRTPTEWAFQWLWNQPEISIVLSGMSSMKQIAENIEVASRSGLNTLTKRELDLVSRVREQYLTYGFIGCTSCRYCMPCPEGVEITEIFSIFNEYLMKNQDIKVKEKYKMKILPDKGAKKCVRCGECEDLCPQQLPIRNLMQDAVFYFESESS
ncbi:MAG: aldo/keto reductase [Candidatus Bathyarchaeota archaeon]|nr:MAG: aldo/keto reductase [Candidatus Bathyarchaeota archaeon]